MTMPRFPRRIPGVNADQIRIAIRLVKALLDLYGDVLNGHGGSRSPPADKIQRFHTSSRNRADNPSVSTGTRGRLEGWFTSPDRARTRAICSTVGASAPPFARLVFPHLETNSSRTSLMVSRPADRGSGLSLSAEGSPQGRTEAAPVSHPGPWAEGKRVSTTATVGRASKT